MTSTMTIRLDSEDKVRFDEFCQSVGLTSSAAVNLFVKATLREGKIPFEIKADPFYSKENMTGLEKNATKMEKTAGKSMRRSWMMKAFHGRCLGRQLLGEAGQKDTETDPPAF